MKLLTAALVTLIAVQTSNAQAGRVCDLVNGTVCNLLRSESSASFGLHASGGNVCRVRLLTNHAFGGLNDKMTKDLIQKLEVKVAGKVVTPLISDRGQLEIDVSGNRAFILNIEVSTLDGRPLKTVLEETLVSDIGLELDAAVLQEKHCETKQDGI